MSGRLPPHWTGVLLALWIAPLGCTSLIGTQDPIERSTSPSGDDAGSEFHDAGGGIHDSGDETQKCATELSACDGRCVDEQTDVQNCGGCGLVCNTPCTSGRCLVTLASGSFTPNAIAVGSTAVLWTTASSMNSPCSKDGTVMSVPKIGGPAATLAAGLDPAAFVANATNFFVADRPNPCGGPMPGGGILDGSPSAGSAPLSTLVSMATPQAGFANSLGLDETHVYWNSGNAIGSVPLGGGSVTTLVGPGAGFYSGLAVGAEDVFFTVPVCQLGNCANVRSVPIEGGSVSSFASELTPGWTVSGIAADGSSVYWGAGGCVSSMPGGCGSAILRTPAGGGASITLATLSSNDSGPSAVVADGTSVYSVEGYCAGDGGPCGGSILTKVPVDGGTVTTLAFDVGAIAVDATSVYWTHSTFSVGAQGAIMKLTPK